MIEVCCAIICEGSKFLAVQKGPGSSHPMKWEFPGGKIQENETPEQCIVREIKEELGIEIQILEQWNSVEFNYADKHILLIPFICLVISGQLALTEHIEIKWFEYDQWKSIDWVDADFEVISKNQELLKSI